MTDANWAQADYWSSSAGLKWIEHENALDTAMAGMLEAVIDAAAITENSRVLDVGCGTGASTLEAAKRAPCGGVIGVDISQPLLDRARSRSKAEGHKNISFLLADAQTHSFGRENIDILVSRVGMSFFWDTVAALENLASSMCRGGRMAFVSWASVDTNPWFYIPKVVAEKRLGTLPKSDPTAPGPTAFQDADRVAGLMKQAGLLNISAQPVEIVLTPPNGIPGAAGAASRVGPAARIMKAFNGTHTDAQAIEEAVEREFAQFEDKGEVRVPALVNLFICTT